MNPAGVHTDLEAPTGRELGEGPPGDVRHQVAEPIHMHDRSSQDAARDARPDDVKTDVLRHLGAERVGRDPLREVRGGRSEEVPSVKRIADLWTHKRPIRDLEDPPDRLPFVYEGEDPIVRAHEELISGRDHERLPFASHARVHHDAVYRAIRKMPIRVRQHERRIRDILWRKVVGNVHDLYFGIDAQDHALHRAHEIVPRSEIGGQRDDAGGTDHRFPFLAISTRMYGTRTTRIFTDRSIERLG